MSFNQNCLFTVDPGIKFENGHQLPIGLFHFYPYRGMEGKCPEGVPELFSKAGKGWSQGLKSSFQGVRTSFPEGSYQLGLAFQGHT